MKQLLLLLLFPFLIFSQNIQWDCSSLTILQNDTTICKGDSLELSAPLGYNYIWSTGDTVSSIIVSPYETSIFSVQISNAAIDLDSIDLNMLCDNTNLLGDVNNDQLINVQDIVIIVDWMLAGEYNSCGDVNCDQLLNEEDVNIIEDFILGFGSIDGCLNCIDDVVIFVETCGCLDPLACNYCPSCTMDDNSCWYDCNENIFEQNNSPRILSEKLTFLGRKTNQNKGLQLEIYDDGSVEKKYIIK